MEYASGTSSWRTVMRRGYSLLPLRRRRPTMWSALVPVVALLTGLLVTTSAHTARGTALRDDANGCAAAIASFDLLREDNTLSRITRLEAQLKEGLSPLGRLPIVGDVRVLGGVAALELVSDKTTKDAGGYLDGIGPRLSAAFLERGLLLRPLGHVLYVMPPYVITDDEVAWVIDQISEVLQQVT